MNLDQLRIFYVAATKRNFTNTAKTLHLSQPSVSLQIQQLEEALDVKLFERTTRSIKLTKPGEVLLRHAEKIIGFVREAEKELTLMSQSIHGDLHIGASTTIGEHILPSILGTFKSQYPMVNLRMLIGNSQHILDQMIAQEIHVGFVEASLSHPLLHGQPFLEDELVVICAKKYQHPLLMNKQVLTPHDLFSLPLVLREPGSGTRQVINESLRQLNLDPDGLNVVLELGNTEAVKAAVEAGTGISLLSKSAIWKEVKLGILRKVKMKGMNLSRNFYLVHDKNKMLPSAAYTFIDYVLAKVQQEHG